MVPVEIVADVDFDSAAWYPFINLAIDSMFILDIIVNLNTSFEADQEVIYLRKLIARHYLRTRFTIDLLSAFPIDLFAGLFFSEDAKELKALSLLKLVRMLRLSRIIRALNVKRDIKSKVKLMQVFFILLLYIHCQACILWFIIIDSKLWNDPILSNDVLWQGRFYADHLYA